MAIRYLTTAMASLICWGICLDVTLGQAPATLVEPEESSNRSGLSEIDRGGFKSSAAQGHIGRSAEDVRQLFRELQGPGRRQQNADMNIENLNKRRDARRRRQSQQKPPPPVHVHFRPSFNVRRTPSGEMVSSMQAQLARLLRKREAGAVRVVLNGRTATLTGTVKSEYERRLLATMLRIEPGVSSVENLVVVEGQAVMPPQAPVP